MAQYMSGPQFEAFVAEILRARGYQATVLGGSGDQGVDVIAARNDQRIAIQCKNYAKPVNNRPVQEVYAGARHHGCNKAAVVAPMGFTKGAFALARSVEVDLYDSASLRAWIRRIQS
jgi:restriction system protein